MLASLLFPYDNDADSVAKTTRADVEAWLAELEREGCITRYESNGSTYLEISNWLIHQKIDKPSKPQFPEPSRPLASIREVSSEEGKGEEGKGEEGSSSAGAPPPIDPPSEDSSGKPLKTRGTRLAVDWHPSTEDMRWAIDARPDIDVKVEVETFRDYWKAKAGPDAVKVDWPATWRNWIRRSHSQRSGGQRPPEAPRKRQELRR
jgi:hypothetical protein